MAEDLAAGRAVAVSAPATRSGLFTGPLFTLMKAFDAIRVARELSRRGVPAVPVFWALTDDHDLQEIARPRGRTAKGPQSSSSRAPTGRTASPSAACPIPSASRADRRRLPRPTRQGADADGSPRGLRPPQRAGRALRRSLHRDAARPRGARAAARARAADPAVRPRPTVAVLPDAAEQARTRSRRLSRDAAQRLERPGSPVPAPFARRVSVLPDRRRRAPPRDDPERALARGRTGPRGPRPTS